MYSYYSKAFKFLVIIIFFFFSVSVVASSGSSEKDEIREMVNQLWKKGFDCYAKGDYQQAYEFFMKSWDVPEDCKMGHSMDAINHCLYLLGREDEIDTHISWNGGRFYQELDTIPFIDEETFQKLQAAKESGNIDEELKVYYDVLKTDTLNELQNRWIHFERLYYFGGICEYNGLYEKAILILRSALELERNLTPPKFRYNLFSTAKEVANAYLNYGLADSALFVAQRHIQECPTPSSKPAILNGYANAENLLIHVYMRLQMYDEALEEIELADSIINSYDSNNHHMYAAFWKIEYYNAIGRHDKALEITKKQAELNIKSGLKWDFLTIDNGIRLVNNLMKINDFPNACLIQRSIVDCCDTTIVMSNIYGEQYTLMGVLSINNNDYENASYWLNKADSILTQVYYPHSSAGNNNKFWQVAMSIMMNSDSLYKEKMMEYEKLVSASYDSLSYVPDIHMLKGVYEANRSNWDVAIEHFLKHLEYPNLDQYVTLGNLSQCYLLKNEPDSAYLYANSLVNDRRNYIIQNFENLSSRERELFWDKASDPFNKLCVSIIKSERKDLVGQLYDDIALYSKGLLLTASSSPDYLERLQINWHDIQQCLKKKEAAVEFIAAPHENPDSSIYVALVLRHDSEQPVMIKLCKGEEIKSAINDGYTSTMLSDLIWRPLRSELIGIKKIWFSVDGMLHKVPLEYLLYDKNKNVNDIYQLHRLTSTRELVIHNSNSTEGEAVLYGDLDYCSSCDNSSGNDFGETLVRSAAKKPLLFTKDEINKVSAVLHKKGLRCEIFNHEQGTRSSIISLDQHPISFLHLATHGYYYEADSVRKEMTAIPSLLGSSIKSMSQAEKAMLRSGLVMSDSILTAYDVSHLSFPGLRLVTLSACGSGLGDIGRGEGVFGLQRAFKQAGAKTILMTLWDVDDYMTYRFMEHFYNKVSSGSSMQKALKSAQKMVLNTKVNKKYVYRDPKYWAGYILLDAIN